MCEFIIECLYYLKNPEISESSSLQEAPNQSVDNTQVLDASL